MAEAENVYKLVIVGSGAVGKSAITMRFVSDTYKKKYDPTVEDFYKKNVEVGGIAGVAEILDTAGQDEFSALRDSYLKEGRGFIIVYAINSAPSFDACQDLYNVVCKVKQTKTVPIILVGNKMDLEDDRLVSKEDGEKKAEEFGCDFMETSAKTGENVNQVFDILLNKVKIDMEASRKKKRRICTIL
eukprot:gnl/Carplike_NY0171/419_a576_4518.p1 GENE.gnl/Carplike_NY0171/419_a576_4518~~gnl/Carplike_NY0171/419_a576_4518.p1  ORF type:complete len:200 (+),score=62.58 gnl/Carplike_NY0171/419_a576_4518:41-601(+)